MRTWTAALVVGGVAACATPAPPVHYPQPRITEHGQTPPEASPAITDRAEQGPFQPDAHLYACNFNFSNRPHTDTRNRIVDYDPIIVVNEVLLATAPVNDACMTSGFGWRRNRMHKGIDLQAKPAGLVYAAAPGIIREVSVQNGFGNQVVIDHGRGVFTRYGHLAYFSEGLRPGQKIGFGQPLGRMGRTGNATAVHLHFEILTGRYNNPKKSFGLEAHNPLDFPGWEGLDATSWTSME